MDVGDINIKRHTKWYPRLPPKDGNVSTFVSYLEWEGGNWKPREPLASISNYSKSKASNFLF